MKESDLGLLLLPYGNDCSWEVGWYAGQGKPLVVFTHNETEWLKDWMVKSSITAVITDNQKTYLKLKKDPILSTKRIILIGDLDELSDRLVSIIKNIKR